MEGADVESEQVENDGVEGGVDVENDQELLLGELEMEELHTGRNENSTGERHPDVDTRS